jgi:excisionase family DNA binding protein
MRRRNESRLLGAKATAEAVGVCALTLKQLARSGKLPCYRLGERIVRFDIDEVKAFMRLQAEGQQAGGDEPERAASFPCERCSTLAGGVESIEGGRARA